MQCTIALVSDKQSDCIKARNRMLLDFLHISRKRYVFFLNRASKVGILYWTWWLLTLTLQGRLYRAFYPKLQATRKLCMHDFLKFSIIVMYTWDYKSTFTKNRAFLAAFEHREKEARCLLAAQYWYRNCLWISLSCESSVSNTIPRYL